MKRWDDKLWLFTIAEYEQLPDGFELTCIDGKKVVKGNGYVDMDTRFDCIAYGVDDPINHPYAELITLLRLS